MFDSGVTGSAGATTGATLLPVLRRCSAAVVAPRSVDGLPARVLLDGAAACEQLVTQVQVLQARLLAALQVEPADAVEAAYRRPDLDPGPEVVSVHEVALVLGVGVETARTRLGTAETVSAGLPGVAAAAQDGWLRWWQVRRAAEAVAGLDAQSRTRVDEHLAEAARAGRCRSRFSAVLDRTVLAAAPAVAEERRSAGINERTVWFRPVGDGMSAFGGLLPAEGAVTVAACLTRLARTPLAAPPLRCGVDGRTLDHARADALVGLAGRILDDLLDPTTTPAPKTATTPTAATPAPAVGSARRTPGGRPEMSPGTGGGRAGRALTTGGALIPTAGVTRRVARRAARQDRRADERLTRALERLTSAGMLHEEQLAAGAPSRLGGAPRLRGGRPTGEIRVTVSAETLLGVSEAPGDLAGYGPITAAHARQLAHRAGATWRRLLTDPATGTVLDVGRTRYRPPEALADLVRTRYGGRCTRPGCAHRGLDLDHIVEWAAGGDTEHRNLHPVCRGCHTARHRDWQVTLHDDGALTWVTPHGHSASTPATDLRPEDLHRPATQHPGAACRAGGNPSENSVAGVVLDGRDDPPPF